jgi:hypothetical protein
VPLVFDHLRLDLRKFPHLMTQRRGVLSRQLLATAPTGRRFQGDDLVALSRREERTLLPGVAGLTTRTAGRLGLGSWRLGVGVFGTGGNRGIAWGLVELVLQLPHRGEEGADDGLGFRGLAGNQLFGDLQRHALHVGEKLASGQTDTQEPHPRPWPITTQGIGTASVEPIEHLTKHTDKDFVFSLSRVREGERKRQPCSHA